MFLDNHWAMKKRFSMQMTDQLCNEAQIPMQGEVLISLGRKCLMYVACAGLLSVELKVANESQVF
jgi:hypothetical protein